MAKGPKTWNETKTKILILGSKYAYNCSPYIGVKHKEQMPKHKKKEVSAIPVTPCTF
jgi:hypothetical protein